jgi:hypothetical protein
VFRKYRKRRQEKAAKLREQHKREKAAGFDHADSESSSASDASDENSPILKKTKISSTPREPPAATLQAQFDAAAVKPKPLTKMDVFELFKKLDHSKPATSSADPRSEHPEWYKEFCKNKTAQTKRKKQALKKKQKHTTRKRKRVIVDESEDDWQDVTVPENDSATENDDDGADEVSFAHFCFFCQCITLKYFTYFYFFCAGLWRQWNPIHHRHPFPQEAPPPRPPVRQEGGKAQKGGQSQTPDESFHPDAIDHCIC